MIIVYQYLNQQSLTVTSVQQHVPTPLSRFLSLSFPLNLKQWCQQRRVRLIMKKHLNERQKQLYAITEVRWNSGPQMVMHCPKYKTLKHFLFCQTFVVVCLWPTNVKTMWMIQLPVSTKQSHKIYTTNTNLKQSNKIYNTNTKLYNTNTN